jgi:hypothetical protein
MPKRRKMPSLRRRSSSAAGEEPDVTRLTRERDEALEQLSATSKVLRIISLSSGDLEPVFQAMLADATRICDAKFGAVYRCEGNVMRFVAMHNLPPGLTAGCTLSSRPEALFWAHNGDQKDGSRRGSDNRAGLC